VTEGIWCSKPYIPSELELNAEPGILAVCVANPIFLLNRTLAEILGYAKAGKVYKN